MSVPNEIRNLIEGVVTSFASGIGAVGALIDNGLEILEGYRREQEAIRGSLREALASVGSLRRKDFDGVMERVLTFQSLREADIKTLIREFLGRQRELAARLKRSLEAGIFPEVERIKNELAGMIAEARGEIQSFQREQERIHKAFMDLEDRKGKISAQEFKAVIHGLETDLLGTDAQRNVVGERS